MFEEIKNRDAWSTLRGFVYQVDTTILRWLDLKDNEILELEKGEDIDIITHDFEKKEISRELEQIKYREANITLNQEVVFDILFNFYLHRRNNPNKKIYFRFISNTNFGIERPALFIDGTSGIEAWIELRKASTINKDDERYITIKDHLVKKISEKISENKKNTDKEQESQNKIKDFILYIENDNQLIEFILDFEWCLEGDDHKQISDSIKRKILNLNIIDNNRKVDLLYSRLFFYIFKFLCSKELKIVNKNELINQASLKELNDNDQQVFNFINSLIENLFTKVNDLESRVSINSSQIATLINKISLINNSDTLFDFKIKNISTNPPLLVKNGTRRKGKVSEIKKIFEIYNWVNFQGINGSGKSQLASLVCIEFENYYWLDLRALNSNIEKSTFLIEVFFSLISNCPIVNDRELWATNIKNSLPKNTIIVLNDLPKIEKDSELSHFLALMTNNTEKTNLKILSTSNFNIPTSTKELLETGILYEYQNFDFNEQEILECLKNNGASESAIKYIDLIATVSQRNPRLVNAIIHHLKGLKWGNNSIDLFEVLFNKEFSKEILQDSQKSIKNYIKDEKSRELLYRLSLIHWDFKIENIIAISNVDEAIIYPNEKLEDLLYLWIQKQDDLYQVSPLIYDIGENNLPEVVKQNTHIAIANSILSTKTINQLSTSRSITSFIKGKDFNNAGFVLIKVYQSARTVEEVNLLNNWAYLNYWLELDIPKEMSILIRVNIRSEQIRLFKIIQKDSTILYSRLEEYALEETMTISEKLFVHFICLANFKDKDLTYYWKHVDFILKNYKQVDPFFKDVLNDDSFSGFLWLPIYSLTTHKDLSLWIHYIEILESNSEIEFFNNTTAEAALIIICNEISNSENNSWEEKITLLRYLREYFIDKKLELLSIYALKSIISIEFDIFKNQTKADELTVEAIASLSLIDSKFLLYENLGRLYFYDKNNNKSKPWLLKAIETNCISQPNYISALISGASTISLEDSSKALEYCKIAVELANTRDDYDELDIIKTLGELAIAFWLDGDLENCLANFENIVNRLLIIKNDNDHQKWIRIFIMSGHILGYLSSVVGRGRVPNLKGEIYEKPYQGILFFTTSDLTDLYKEKNTPLLLALLALFSYGVNNISRAGYWALRAFDLARKNDDQEIFLMISSICSQYALINFNLEEAFESSLLFSAVSSHTVDGFKESYLNFDNTKIQDLLSIKPSKEWDIAEDTTLGFTIIPLFIKVYTYSLTNKDDDKYFHEYINMLKNYLPKASNLVLWEVVIELTTRIYKNRISIKELTDRGNTFGSNEQNNLQIICSLGIILTSKNSNQRFNQILNIFPYFTNKFNTFDSIIKYVLLPITKFLCLEILDDIFVGSRGELNEIRSFIENISINYENALQLTIQPLGNLLDIEMPENRKSWLFDLK